MPILLSPIRPFARCLTRIALVAVIPFRNQAGLPKGIGASLNKGLETRFHTQGSLLARASSVPPEEGISHQISSIFDKYAPSSTIGASSVIRREDFEACREEVKRALSPSEEALPASSITIPLVDPKFPALPVQYVQEFDSLEPDVSLRRIGVYSMWKEAIISAMVFRMASSEESSAKFEIDLCLYNRTKVCENKEMDDALLFKWLDDCRIDYWKEMPLEILTINEPYSARKLLGLLAKSHQIPDSAYLPAKKAAENMRLRALGKK